MSESKEKGHLCTSQRHALIVLMKKKCKGKRLTQNWKSISLLSVNLEIMSKVLSEKIEKVLPDLVSTQQTAYVKNSYIGDGWRLISDIIEIARLKKTFLATMDIEKAFYTLDHNFLISTLGKYGFGKNFIL